MADTKISGMTAASALTGAEVLPVVQSAANVKATTQQVVDAAMTTGLTRQALGSINTNTTIDWSAGSYVTATIGGALTFTFSNPAPTGKACVAYLQLTNGGSAVITWPVSVTWSGGTAPTLRASGVDLLRFYTQDGGTTWFGTSENDEPDTTNTPGGSATELQYRSSATTFGGMAGTAWDNTNRALTITGATVTTSNPVISVSQTWNAAGVAFVGTYTQITNTASAAGSYVDRVDVGGTRVFSLDTSGNIQCASIGPRTYARFAVSGALGVDLSGGGYLTASIGDGLFLRANVPFGWSNSNSTSNATGDLFLYRDAAATLAQRNGTNAQTFRVYRSYTDASNYSRWTVKWNTSTAILHAEGAGTGTDGSVAFNDAALATDATRGFLMIPSCAGTPTGTPADIPTGQAPIVYDSTNKKLAVWDGAAWVQTASLT